MKTLVLLFVVLLTGGPQTPRQADSVRRVQMAEIYYVGDKEGYLAANRELIEYHARNGNEKYLFNAYATMLDRLQMWDLVHFSLEGSSQEEAGNYTLSCDKLAPVHFERFTYVLVDIPDSYHLELGPWTDFALGNPGSAIPGSYYYGGIEFNCYLTDGFGSETEFVFYLVNNNGTPEDPSDDITYSLTKTATFYGKEAIRFPSLEYSGEWEILTPSDMNPQFNGYNDEVAW